MYKSNQESSHAQCAHSIVFIRIIKCLFNWQKAITSYHYSIVDYSTFNPIIRFIEWEQSVYKKKWTSKITTLGWDTTHTHTDERQYFRLLPTNWQWEWTASAATANLSAKAQRIRMNWMCLCCFFFLYDISAINQPALDCCTIVAHKFTPPSDIVSTKQLIKVTPTTIDFHFVWSSCIYKNGHHFFLYIYSFMHWHIPLRRRIWNNNVKWTTAAATVKYKWQQIPSSTYLINSIKFRFRTIENFCINSK